jgi:poly(glycerol-phosphate) alpha-glucosyltransferase
MPRILELTDSISRLGGGVAESVRCLTRDLGHAATGSMEITLAAAEDAATAQDRVLFEHVETVTFPRRAFGPVPFSPGLTRFVGQSDPGLVHLHGVWGVASRALAMARRPGMPWMVSPHGMLEPWAMRQGRWKRWIAWRLWDGPVLRGASCLHALCPEEWLSIRAAGLENPVAVIPNGVDLPDEPVRSLGSSVLFLGRIHPKKGLTELLHAWALLPKAPLLRIAGWDDGGHLPGLLKLRDELGLTTCVEFSGPAFGPGKDRLYREAGAVILPSHSEGLPMTVLEAWAYGLPVLMTDHCHLPEGFSRQAAIRVEPLPFSIAEGMRTFLTLSEPERQAMGRRGRELVSASYSWDHVARQFLSVYRWLLGGTKPAFVQ